MKRIVLALITAVALIWGLIMAVPLIWGVSLSEGTPSPDISIDTSQPSGLRSVVIEEGFALGGRRAVDQVSTGGQDVSGQTIKTGLPFDFFHRAWRTRIRLVLDESDENGTIPVKPTGEYAIDLILSGHAAVALQMGEYSADGNLLRYMPMTTFELVGHRPPRDFGMRFLVSPDATAVQPVLWVAGRTVVNIHRADFVRFD